MSDPFRKSTIDETLKSFDAYAHAMTMIREEHRMVHDGFMFHATSRFASLANGGTYQVLLNVPAGAFPHIQRALFHLEAGPCDIEVFEGTTTSADGTALTANNQNRNSANTSDTVITHTPTVTGDGTQIHDLYIPSGGKEVGSISQSTGEEWVLKPSTKYLIRLTNNTGAIMDGSFEINWYEIDYEY